jgi:hypothetical protein
MPRPRVTWRPPRDTARSTAGAPRSYPYRPLICDWPSLSACALRASKLSGLATAQPRREKWHLGGNPILGPTHRSARELGNHTSYPIGAVVSVMVSKARGRRGKTRPTFGTAVTSEMSLRDISAALGVSRKELQRWKTMAELPAADVEAYLTKCRETKTPARSRDLELLARRRAGKSTERERHCPNCDYLLHIEDAG